MKASKQDEDFYLGKGHRSYLQNLDRMRRFARMGNAFFLVSVQPEIGCRATRTQSEREMIANLEKGQGYAGKLRLPERYQAMAGAAGAFCETQGIPFVDMNSEPAFQDHPEWLFYDSCHFNEKGNEITAEILAAKIRQAFPFVN